jgi:hypothetical protein
MRQTDRNASGQRSRNRSSSFVCCLHQTWPTASRDDVWHDPVRPSTPRTPQSQFLCKEIDAVVHVAHPLSSGQSCQHFLLLQALGWRRRRVFKLHRSRGGRRRLGRGGTRQLYNAHIQNCVRRRRRRRRLSLTAASALATARACSAWLFARADPKNRIACLTPQASKRCCGSRNSVRIRTVFPPALLSHAVFLKATTFQQNDKECSYCATVQ